MDRHTLRFYGFFEEKVSESAFEKNRIRNLIIYYYLEDMSVSIIEKTQNNSGIPQGDFLMRRKVLRNDGSGLLLTPEDFMVGYATEIYGKNIMITGCD